MIQNPLAMHIPVFFQICICIFILSLCELKLFFFFFPLVCNMLSELNAKVFGLADFYFYTAQCDPETEMSLWGLA